MKLRQLLQEGFSNAASLKQWWKNYQKMYTYHRGKIWEDILVAKWMPKYNWTFSAQVEDPQMSYFKQACDLPYCTLTWQRCILATVLSCESQAHIFTHWTWCSAALWAPAMTFFFSWQAYTAPWSGLRTALTFTIYLCKPMGHMPPEHYLLIRLWTDHTPALGISHNSQVKIQSCPISGTYQRTA